MAIPDTGANQLIIYYDIYVRYPCIHYIYLPLTCLPLGLLPDVPSGVWILCSPTVGYNTFPLVSLCLSKSQTICGSPSGWISLSYPTPQKSHVRHIGHWTSPRPSFTIWYNSLKNLSSSPSFTNFSLSLLMLPFHCLLPHPWHISLRFPWHTSLILSWHTFLILPWHSPLSSLSFPFPKSSPSLHQKHSVSFHYALLLKIRPPWASKRVTFG